MTQDRYPDNAPTTCGVKHLDIAASGLAERLTAFGEPTLRDQVRGLLDEVANAIRLTEAEGVQDGDVKLTFADAEVAGAGALARPWTVRCIESPRTEVRGSRVTHTCGIVEITSRDQHVMVGIDPGVGGEWRDRTPRLVHPFLLVGSPDPSGAAQRQFTPLEIASFGIAAELNSIGIGDDVTARRISDVLAGAADAVRLRQLDGTDGDDRLLSFDDVEVQTPSGAAWTVRCVKPPLRKVRDRRLVAYSPGIIEISHHDVNLAVGVTIGPDDRWRETRPRWMLPALRPGTPAAKCDPWAIYRDA